MNRREFVRGGFLAAIGGLVGKVKGTGKDELAEQLAEREQMCEFLWTMNDHHQKMTAHHWKMELRAIDEAKQLRARVDELENQLWFADCMDMQNRMVCEEINRLRGQLYELNMENRKLRGLKTDPTWENAGVEIGT